MAEVKNKSAAGEKAIARLVAQLDKVVAKRQWGAAVNAAAICYLAEAHGAKFPNAEARTAFRADMADSDWSFSSNMKAYLTKRGILPAKDEYTTATLE